METSARTPQRVVFTLKSTFSKTMTTMPSLDQELTTTQSNSHHSKPARFQSVFSSSALQLNVLMKASRELESLQQLDREHTP